jgi:NADH-quinone oxidoreductase subunit N
MFSLTGIPPTAGFIGKFNLFVAVIHAGYTWLVIIAVLFSVISAFYYLRVIMNMYMRSATHEASITSSPSLWLALIVTVVAVLAIGILPSIVLTGSSLCWQ